MRLRWLVILLAFLTSCRNGDVIAIHGDSTAVGSRAGIAKIFNIAPIWDSRRWWVQVARSLNRTPFNDGVGGQDMRTLREKMEKDENHRYVTTIIYDRRNDGEDPKEYIEDLSRAISCLKTERFLILPQVPQSFGRTESQEQISAMREIDDAVVAKWPKNTFSIPERSSFLSDLSDDSTRIDGLHRNEKGQAIEAKWITKWLQERSW